MKEKPITRKEAYYKYLIDGEGDLPEPITREDAYLYYLCINGFGIGGGGIGGASNYNALTGKPQINSVTLQGNRSLKDIGIDTETLDIDFSGYFT